MKSSKDIEPRVGMQVKLFGAWRAKIISMYGSPSLALDGADYDNMPEGFE